MTAKLRNRAFVLSAAVFLLGCQQPQPPGSKEAAIHDAWQKFCSGYYCEGYSGSITSIEDDHIVVNINGNTRYLYYGVTGEPGSYKATVAPTHDGGKAKP